MPFYDENLTHGVIYHAANFHLNIPECHTCTSRLVSIMLQNLPIMLFSVHFPNFFAYYNYMLIFMLPKYKVMLTIFADYGEN